GKLLGIRRPSMPVALFVQQFLNSFLKACSLTEFTETIHVGVEKEYSVFVKRNIVGTTLRSYAQLGPAVEENEFFARTNCAEKIFSTAGAVVSSPTIGSGPW